MGDLGHVTLTGNQIAGIIAVFSLILLVSIVAAYREGVKDR